EQEVEISKRIESADNEIRRITYSLGFAGKEHIALAEKLLAVPPKERFDRVILDKKVASRQSYLRTLRRLLKRTRELDVALDQTYAQWRDASAQGESGKLQARFQSLDQKLQTTFAKFFFKQRVTEEMALVAENIHDKLQASLRLLQEFEDS